jgi:hypothetical protein
MMDKEIIIRTDRLRKTPESFAWIDHRLRREGYLRMMSGHDVRVYLFLVLVGNRNGVSFWRDRRICTYLGITGEELIRSRDNLISLSLICHSPQYYQVLSIPETEITMLMQRWPSLLDICHFPAI